MQVTWTHTVNLYCIAGQKLREASAQQQFNREVDDLNLWLSETEGHLSSENLGNVRELTHHWYQTHSHFKPLA